MAEDLRVAISTPGGPEIETTVGQMKKAVERLNSNSRLSTIIERLERLSATANPFFFHRNRSPARKRRAGAPEVSLQRVTLLSQPPVIGEWYLVPTCRHPWHGRVHDWPVFLPLHEDAEHLNFPHQHYHIDPRFVDAHSWQFAKRHGAFKSYAEPLEERSSYAAVQLSPLSCRFEVHPAIVWKRIRCKRDIGPYNFKKQIAERLTPQFVGEQCRNSKTGWICPHKRVPLGSFPVIDGTITCPLHGLQIDAATGKVTGPCSEKEAA